MTYAIVLFTHDMKTKAREVKTGFETKAGARAVLRSTAEELFPDDTVKGAGSEDALMIWREKTVIATVAIEDEGAFS